MNQMISVATRNVTRRCARRISLAGEPARGLGASRRPFGDVRFTGSPARCDGAHAGQRPTLPRLYRGTTTKQQPMKVSTLSQDLTSLLVSQHGRGKYGHHCHNVHADHSRNH